MYKASRHNVAQVTSCLPGIEAISITSDRVFPRHAHDTFGIGVMQAGGHASWSGSGTVEAGPGDVIAVNPEEMHDGAPIGDTRAWHMLYIEPDVVARLCGTEAATREIGFAARTAPDLSAAILNAIRTLATGDGKAAEEALTALLADLLVPEPPGGSGKTSPATLRVLDRIRACPADPPTLDEVAALMGMGRTGALRRFRREAGATPHEHAMQLRLRLARRALIAGDSPATVAIDLGFADQSHLTRAFARQFGLPPGRFRAGPISFKTPADATARRGV